jgi:UDP-glucose 4-epimerase
MPRDKKPYQKILITGGLGHIGSQLIRKLDPSLTSDLVILDNLEARRFPSLFSLPTRFRYTFVHDDILTADFETLLSGVPVVIHLAAVTDAEGNQNIPEIVEAVNYKGLVRVADACMKTGTALLLPSTTSVYGSQDARVDETCTELRPQSTYAETKLAAERHLNGLRPRGLAYVACRFATIFGFSVGMRFDTAVNRFSWQAVHGWPLTVWRTAWNQKRPYLYLGDCIRAINFILKKRVFDGEIYNVLTENFTVKDVVTAIRKLVPDTKVTYVDSRIMNQLSYDVDDTKFRRLGFVPRGSLVRGIAEAMEQLTAFHSPRMRRP